MWPLWLIIAVAVGSATTLTTFCVLGAVYIERRRHQSLIARQRLDRNLSQNHRHHLSITDVDFSSLPRPVRNLRHSLQGSRRDSRFYSMMASETEISAFPDGTAESMAEASYIVTDANRSNQWLSPTKSRKEHRKKKSIKLSISAPMARSPMSVITEQTESTRLGSPEPVELPTQSTPKVTPTGSPTLQKTLSARAGRSQQASIDSVISVQKEHSNRVSMRISHGNAIKSRSISMGSIAPPPDCPLPPVPEGTPSEKSYKPSLNRSKSDLSAHVRSLSLLNSPLSSPADQISLPNGTTKRESELSRFDFGLQDETVQVIKVDIDPPKNYTAELSERTLQSAPSVRLTGKRTIPMIQNDGFLKTIDASRWNSPRSVRHVGCSNANYPSNISEPGSRPISAISAMSLAEYGMLHSTRSSPTRSAREPTSRPISISSIDLFRRSVVGPDAPVLIPDSPRNKGHKRQNCIRISGLTPIDVAKKRLSSQLDRLAEAEETDSEDNRSVGIEIPTISPARPVGVHSPAKRVRTNETKLDVPKIRQPQALSLRVRRPGLLDRVGAASPSPTSTQSDLPTDQSNSRLQIDSSLSPPLRPSNPLHRSHPTESQFVYAGSPLSDPTKPRPPDQEFSPVSPPTPVAVATTPGIEQPPSISKSDTRFAFSATSAPPVFSTTTTSHTQITSCPVTDTTATGSNSPRRTRTSSTLYGPRSAPPPSLRTRNKTGCLNRNSPRLRQTSDQRSTSPIRKASQSKTPSNTIQQRNRSANQDDLQRSIALLRSLTYAAEVGKGGVLDQANMIKKSDESQIATTPADSKVAGIMRTPSNHYAISPGASNSSNQRAGDQLRVPRQRSKTVVGYSIAPPKLRQEATYPSAETQRTVHSSDLQSRISIWEDASIRGDSDSESLSAREPSSSACQQHSQRLERITHHQNDYAKIQQQTTLSPSTSNQSDTPSKPLQRESLWKLQQNADLVTSRALAFNHNIKMNACKSPKAGSEKQSKPLKMGDLVATLQSPSVTENTTATGKEQIRQRDGSAGQGPRQRQRSQTVATTSNSTNKARTKDDNVVDGLARLKTREDVGLGVNFGRTGLGREIHGHAGRVSNRDSEDVVFLNEMERDGIGRLR